MIDSVLDSVLDSVAAREWPGLDADLAAALRPFYDGGTFPQTVSYACELARKPA